MKRVKITKDDRFVWHVLNKGEALHYMRIGIPVYKLYDDDSEGLVESEDQLNDNDMFGVEVGFLDDDMNR